MRMIEEILCLYYNVYPMQEVYAPPTTGIYASSTPATQTQHGYGELSCCQSVWWCTPYIVRDKPRSMQFANVARMRFGYYLHTSMECTLPNVLALWRPENVFLLSPATMSTIAWMPVIKYFCDVSCQGNSFSILWKTKLYIELNNHNNALARKLHQPVIDLKALLTWNIDFNCHA